MTVTKNGPAAAGTAPDLGSTMKEITMNTGTNNTDAAGAPATVEQLVANHINAVANHDRLFQLQEWSLALEDETRAALGPVNDALLALCAARPTERPQIALRQSYLQIVLPDHVEDDKGRAAAVFGALLGKE